jgi:hypothetical protein
MKVMSAALCMFMATLPMVAGTAEGAVLDYRYRARLADQPAWVEGRFRVLTTPALNVHSRVKQPRMGEWRIEPQAAPGAAAPSAGLLVRALGLCYFSGPTDRTAPLDLTQAFGGRRCRLWKVRVPEAVGAYAYLAEVAPGLLALDYFSAVLPAGEVRSLEIHLAGVALGARTVPVEDGTALLRTLGAWAALASRPAADGTGTGALETEDVP